MVGDNSYIMKKELPEFLTKEQKDLMIGMRKKGYSLGDIAKVFGVSKMVVYNKTKEAFPPTDKSETEK